MATYVGTQNSHVDIDPVVPHEPVDGWSPMTWELHEDLPVQNDVELGNPLRLNLTPAEQTWVEAWNDFVVTLRSAGVERLPGFPVWVDSFIHEDDLMIEDGTPAWKANFLRKNAAFYTQHQEILEAWLERWDYLRDFPASRRKFEWQAQDARSLDDTIMHLRPSGLRAKKSTYVPALSRSPRRASWGNVYGASLLARPRGCRACPSGSTSEASLTPRRTSRWAMA